MKAKPLALLCVSTGLLLMGIISCGDKWGPFPNKFNVVGLDWHIFQAVYDETAEL